MEYEAFAQLNAEFGPRGLVIVLFPTAQFGGLEYASALEVLDFADSKW